MGCSLKYRSVLICILTKIIYYFFSEGRLCGVLYNGNNQKPSVIGSIVTVLCLQKHLSESTFEVMIQYRELTLKSKQILNTYTEMQYTSKYCLKVDIKAVRKSKYCRQKDEQTHPYKIAYDCGKQSWKRELLDGNSLRAEKVCRQHRPSYVEGYFNLLSMVHSFSNVVFQIRID